MLSIIEGYLMIENVIINQQLIILQLLLNLILQKQIFIIIEVLHIENKKSLKKLFWIIPLHFKLILLILKHCLTELFVMTKWVIIFVQIKITKVP